MQQLNEKEVKILKKYLNKSYGIAATQEDIMELLMDKNIANFTVVEAHGARKAIAKKKEKAIVQLRKDYFAKARERTGAREELINYVWEFCIVPQLGYSFSRNHTLPYSIIALQILNLNYKYNKLAWNSACLTVESGAIDQESDSSNTTNYGKVAVAISNMEKIGVRIAPPEINKSGYVFTPDFNENVILFGLKGMSYVGDDVVEEIIKGRPYSTYEDFYKRVNPPKRKMISLIKSDAFRNLTDKTRKELLYEYIQEKTNIKTSLSLRNMGGLFSNKLFSDTEVRDSSVMWYLRKILKSNKIINHKGFSYYKLENNMIEFLNKHAPTLQVETIKDLYCVKEKDFNSAYKKDADILRKYISDNEEKLLKAYNTILIEEEGGNYLEGGIGKWEMDSISYYASENELDYINYEKYNFVEKFENLKIKPIERIWKNKYPIFKLSTIIGTCLDRSKNKHTIKLLTRSGVITVKFYGSNFAYYDKQVKNNGSIVDSSFFSRGNKIMITGYRSGENNFKAKTYSKSKMSQVYLIEKVDENGELSMRSEKYSSFS